MNNLKDYRRILEDKAEEADVFFTKYPENTPQDVALFRDINNTKVKNTMPEIMVYGIYNAGKSSILNELIGEDVAAVRDIPETDKVTYYEWQGYKLADSPGVSAPIAHEEITEAHLKKADIVLFVMSTTGSSEKQDNYNRIKMISDSGKKVIIVLNDKNGDMGRNDEAIRVIKEKVYTNMQRTGIENVDKKYCIVTVNAARAYQGRIKNKPALIERSGIDELRDVILKELKATSSFEVLKRAISQMEQIIDNFIEGLKNEENSVLLKKMNQVLDTFDKEKLNMRRQINLYIDLQADQLAHRLPQVIWDNGDKPEKLEAIIEGEIEKLTDKVQKEIQQQMEAVVAILSMELKSFAEIKVDSLGDEAFVFNNILDKFAKISNDKVSGIQLGEVADNSSNISPAAITATAAGVELTTGAISSGLTSIAEHLATTTIGKYIAQTAAGKLLGSVAGAVIPVIGPVISVVSAISTLFSLFGGSNEKQLRQQIQQQNAAEQARLRAAMQARQELDQKCLYMADKLANELKNCTIKAIDESLSLYENPFREEIEKLKERGSTIMGDIDRLRALKGEYDLIRVELGGH